MPTGTIQNLGFTWDSHGNLQSRSSARTNAAGAAQENLSEAFTYDDLNRLDTVTTRSGSTSATVDYDYDAHGNLTRNRLGALTYAQTNGASLYGVTAAGGNTYRYDGYGNVTTLGSRTAQYDVFNKPTRIGNTQFVYGPAHEKVKTISGGTTTYHYAGGSYLEESTATGLTSKAYVGGYYLRETTANTTTEHYLHFDHLGSVEAISDAEGNFVSRMSFDAFGNRRNANWTALATPLPANTFATAWGFTGHDMVDAEGLVHMGGRVYDPALGRFLSVDLYVQAPDNSQSYNRYSYVTNNPLSRIDPTGYQSCPAGKICEEVTATGSRRRAHDENATLRGLEAMYFLRDWANNMDWRQMAQTGGDWTAAALETGFSWTVQPLFEGGLEIVFNIQTGNYGAAAGAGIVAGGEMTAGKIARGAKAAEKALEGAEKVAKNALPKSPTGKGAVPPSQRDPKRVWTKKEKSDALDQRNRKCDGCGSDIRVDDARGHHIKRHSDGGSTTDDNLAILCDPCHTEIHRK